MLLIAPKYLTTINPNKMKILMFDGFKVPISDDDLSSDMFDIDFGGVMMVQFTKLDDGTFKPTNAMNGWGDNCYNQIADKEVTIINKPESHE